MKREMTQAETKSEEQDSDKEDNTDGIGSEKQHNKGDSHDNHDSDENE